MTNTNRTLTGTLPDGQQILVRVWAEGGGEVAFRPAPDRWLRWGVPTELVEES